MVHEIAGQPVEQFWMRRARPQQAKITQRSDEAPPKMMGPKTIDEDPRDQGMTPAGQPAGIGEAAAAALETGRRRIHTDLTLSTEDRHLSRGDRLPGLIVIAAMK